MYRTPVIVEANGAIFGPQGEAINAGAADDVRVLVVGNPANTNALITRAHAPDVPAERFTSMMRLDHNRAVARLAGHLDVATTDVSRMVVWGNHSSTQYPDLTHAEVAGRGVRDRVDDAWVRDEFVPVVAGRGAAIIDARGASSAASVAHAAIDQGRDWIQGTPGDDWTSAGVPSDGAHGVPEGLTCSVPVRSVSGRYEAVRDLEVDPFSRERIAAPWSRPRPGRSSSSSRPDRDSPGLRCTCAAGRCTPCCREAPPPSRCPEPVWCRGRRFTGSSWPSTSRSTEIRTVIRPCGTTWAPWSISPPGCARCPERSTCAP